jgi:hypothetical protein
MIFIDTFKKKYNYNEVKDDIMPLEIILDWYKKNVNIPLSNEFLDYIINIGLYTSKGHIEYDNQILEAYSLNELNDLMLKKYNNEFIKNDSNLLLLKENRIILLNNLKSSNNNKIVKVEPINPIVKEKDNKKFKITRINGGKLKLIKSK